VSDKVKKSFSGLQLAMPEQTALQGGAVLSRLGLTLGLGLGMGLGLALASFSCQAQSPRPQEPQGAVGVSASDAARASGLSLGLGLVALCQKAEQGDAQHTAARKALEAALEKIPLARAALLPSVNLSAGSARQTGVSTFSDGPEVDRDPTTRNWSLQFTQPLLRGAQWAGYDQAQSLVAQARSQMAQAQQELVLRCAQAYLDVQLAAQNVQVLDAQQQAMQAQLDVAQRNQVVGTGTVMDVQEARAKHALTRAQRLGAAADLAARHAEVERLVGEPTPLASMRLERLLALPWALGSYSRGEAADSAAPAADWLESAVHSHPQTLAQEAQLAAAQLEATKASREYWPTLDLTASVGANASTGTLASPADMATSTRSQSVGVQLTVPLYGGGATQARMREALALQDKAAAELTATQRAVRAQAQQAYWGLSSGVAQTQALQAAVEAGRAAVQSNTVGYRIGTRISPDVLNAVQQLYTSERDLSKARTDSVMQALKLKAARGALQTDDLAAVQSLLEPVVVPPPTVSVSNP
jgi:outer membrane protein